MKLDDVRSEFAISGVVILYMLLVLLDLVLADDECQDDKASGEGDDSFESKWSFYFNYIDMGFLLLFDSEIGIRLFAYGPIYFYDFWNGLDAAIIVLSTVIGVMVIGEFVFTSNLSFLRVVRLVRLVRLFIVMNKVQNARTAFKRTKYLKLGSPVEKVMDMLSDMKSRTEEEEDIGDIAWIMHLIASDKLYSIDLQSLGAGQSDEMKAFLQGDMGIKKDTTTDEDPGSGNDVAADRGTDIEGNRSSVQVCIHSGGKNSGGPCVRSCGNARVAGRTVPRRTSLQSLTPPSTLLPLLSVLRRPCPHLSSPPSASTPRMPKKYRKPKRAVLRARLRCTPRPTRRARGSSVRQSGENMKRQETAIIGQAGTAEIELVDKISELPEVRRRAPAAAAQPPPPSRRCPAAAAQPPPPTAAAHRCSRPPTVPQRNIALPIATQPKS